MGLIVHVDGGARGNPGPAGAGVTISTEDGQLVHEGAYFLGRQTNNAAEYHALIRALQRIAGTAAEAVTLCSDSELLVRQVTGQYRVKSPKLTQLFQQVQLLLLRIPCWSIRHVPREENLRADELANLAIDTQRDVVVFDSDSPAIAQPPTATDAAAACGDGGRASAPSDEATADVEAVPPEARAARVTLAKAPAEGACPVGGCSCESFTVTSVFPVAICLHAAHALVPTILAVLSTEPGEFAALPTMTVRCMHAGCGATFHVSPTRRTNGSATRAPGD